MRDVSSGSGQRTAFTLLEVMLAVALFTFSVVVLAASYVNVLNALESVKADISLEQELSFVRSQILLEPDLEELEKGGEVPTATHGMADWLATVTPTTIADLFRVDIEIALSGDRDRNTEDRTVNQTIFLLRSSWSEPTERDELRARSKERIDEAKRFRPL